MWALIGSRARHQTKSSPELRRHKQRVIAANQDPPSPIHLIFGRLSPLDKQHIITYLTDISEKDES